MNITCSTQCGCWVGLDVWIALNELFPRTRYGRVAYAHEKHISEDWICAGNLCVQLVTEIIDKCCFTNKLMWILLQLLSVNIHYLHICYSQQQIQTYRLQMQSCAACTHITTFPPILMLNHSGATIENSTNKPGQLKIFVVALLSLPHSIACAERIITILNDLNQDFEISIRMYDKLVLVRKINSNYIRKLTLTRPAYLSSSKAVSCSTRLECEMIRMHYWYGQPVIWWVSFTRSSKV